MSRLDTSVGYVPASTCSAKAGSEPDIAPSRGITIAVNSPTRSAPTNAATWK
ncbi:hypothetical protein [Nonomuraea sp. NPDC046570]|uniref:hypothetical protein n=1 Tax=Nonomuraea sp. NPDC046570 TaxID=3155255 RepID=UPI0033EF4AE4